MILPHSNFIQRDLGHRAEVTSRGSSLGVFPSPSSYFSSFSIVSSTSETIPYLTSTIGPNQDPSLFSSSTSNAIVSSVLSFTSSLPPFSSSSSSSSSAITSSPSSDYRGSVQPTLNPVLAATVPSSQNNAVDWTQLNGGEVSENDDDDIGPPGVLVKTLPTMTSGDILRTATDPSHTSIPPVPKPQTQPAIKVEQIPVAQSNGSRRVTGRELGIGKIVGLLGIVVLVVSLL